MGHLLAEIKTKLVTTLPQDLCQEKTKQNTNTAWYPGTAPAPLHPIPSDEIWSRIFAL